MPKKFCTFDKKNSSFININLKIYNHGNDI